MTNELLALFDYYEKEKGIKRDTMIEALETALLSASRKSIGPARGMRIQIDPEKGDIRAFATLIVRDRVTNPYEEIDIFTARRIRPGIDVDAELEVDITPKNFGRIAAQTAKQTMMQRLRKAEKEVIYEEFKDRARDIVSGTVSRFERGDVYIDLGKFEGLMNRRESVSIEEYNVGDRVRAYVIVVEYGDRGPEIIRSRSHPNFVRRLIESEGSEIADRTVEIRSPAREADHRTTVAVYSADEKVDPVGACVGLRGARVKNIVRELNNEKVDIIRWGDYIRSLVTEALQPTEIKTIMVDEAKKSALVRVAEDEISIEESSVAPKMDFAKRLCSVEDRERMAIETILVAGLSPCFDWEEADQCAETLNGRERRDDSNDLPEFERYFLVSGVRQIFHEVEGRSSKKQCPTEFDGSFS